MFQGLLTHCLSAVKRTILFQSTNSACHSCVVRWPLKPLSSHLVSMLFLHIIQITVLDCWVSIYTYVHIYILNKLRIKPFSTINLAELQLPQILEEFPRILKFHIESTLLLPVPQKWLDGWNMTLCVVHKNIWITRWLDPVNLLWSWSPWIFWFHWNLADLRWGPICRMVAWTTATTSFSCRSLEMAWGWSGGGVSPFAG